MPNEETENINKHQTNKLDTESAGVDNDPLSADFMPTSVSQHSNENIESNDTDEPDNMNNNDIDRDSEEEDELED